LVTWFEALRELFPLCSRRAYFFAGAQAPLATPVRRAMEAVMEVWEADAWRIEEREWRHFDDAAATIADLYGCDPSEVVVAENTSHAMSIATGLVVGRWWQRGGPGANVVIHANAHPAAAYAWLNLARLGAPLEVRWAEHAADGGSGFDGLVDDETLAVVLSHVDHEIGARLAVPEVPAATAVLLDAAQSAGALDLREQVRAADFVGFPAYKWLFGPPGVAFLVARRSWLDEVGPLFAGWASAEDPMRMELRRLTVAAGARGFRLGMPNFAGVAGAAAGLRITAGAGVQSIAARIEALSYRFRAGVDTLGLASPTPRAFDQRAGIVVLDLPEPVALQRTLLGGGIDVGVEQGRLRVDLHAFNTEAEVDMLLDRLDRLCVRA
jgi:selenocysteine lyase/cysteine desulfurase